METAKGIKTIYMNNTKIANQIRKYNDLENVQNKTNVGRSGKGGNTVYVWYVITRNLSYFDCMVADIIYTLILKQDGNPIERTFSLNDISDILYGKKLSPDRKKELQQSVEHLRGTYLDINCFEEVAHRKESSRGEPPQTDSGRFRGAFLAADPAGKTGNRYRVRDTESYMPLYEYAGHVNRQIIAFDSKYLCEQPEDSKETRYVNKERMMIRYELIRRIEQMRNPHNFYPTNEIAYFNKSHPKEGMLPEIGIDLSKYHSPKAKKDKLRKIHETVEQFLELFRSMEYIQRYEPKENGNGFKIYLPEETSPGSG